MGRLSVLAAILVLAGLAAPVAEATPLDLLPMAPNHAIEGHVTDVLGNPLEACVHADGNADNDRLNGPASAVMSDATGAYRLELAPGTYTVQAYTPFVFPGPHRAGESAGCPHGEWKDQEYVHGEESVTTSQTTTTVDFPLRFSVGAWLIGWNGLWPAAARPGDYVEILGSGVSTTLRDQVRVRWADANDATSLLDLPFLGGERPAGDDYGCISYAVRQGACDTVTRYQVPADRADGSYDYDIWLEVERDGDWVEVGRDRWHYWVDSTPPALTSVEVVGEPDRVSNYDPETGTASVELYAEGNDDPVDDPWFAPDFRTHVTVWDETAAGRPVVLDNQMWERWWTDPYSFERQVNVTVGHTYTAEFTPTDYAGNVGPVATLQFTPQAPCDVVCELRSVIPA